MPLLIIDSRSSTISLFLFQFFPTSLVILFLFTYYFETFTSASLEHIVLLLYPLLFLAKVALVAFMSAKYVHE